MTSYEGTHPTVLVRVGSRSAQIDDQLAPTIQAIWECGFDTFTCCQDLAESNADWPEKLPHMAEWVKSRRGWMLIDFPVDSAHRNHRPPPGRARLRPPSTDPCRVLPAHGRLGEPNLWAQIDPESGAPGMDCINVQRNV
ncbi:hypothetical protein ACWD25_55975 [Streptomyces sp. NPDC002920]